MQDGKRCILIADDEKEIRDILGLLLTGEGYVVVSAEDGQQAVDMADESVDLYILDVGMPRLSGIMAAARIRSRRAQALKALLAGEHRALGAGAADQETGRALGDVLIHQLVEHRYVELAVLRKRGDRGDEEAAHALHLLHMKSPFREGSCCISLIMKFGMHGKNSCFTRGAASSR